MAVRDWDAGRIRRMWAAGFAAELLVILTIFVLPPYTRDRPERIAPDSRGFRGRIAR